MSQSPFVESHDLDTGERQEEHTQQDFVVFLSVVYNRASSLSCNILHREQLQKRKIPNQ